MLFQSGKAVRLRAANSITKSDITSMAKNRKYSSVISQEGSQWSARIVRQVTSRKTLVSKEQTGFESEEKALEWAEQQLAEFSATQSTSNKRHGEQRKLNEEERRQRSSRRAEKTLNAKMFKAEQELREKELVDAEVTEEELAEADETKEETGAG